MQHNKKLNGTDSYYIYASVDFKLAVRVDAINENEALMKAGDAICRFNFTADEIIDISTIDFTRAEKII